MPNVKILINLQGQLLGRRSFKRDQTIHEKNICFQPLTLVFEYYCDVFVLGDEIPDVDAEKLLTPQDIIDYIARMHIVDSPTPK